tara:strand:- start:5054 stop:5458 length:405 start_codon:yes stop_codon:yes gene_type:complete
MIDEVEQMSVEEHVHMTSIVKNFKAGDNDNSINFTENENGIFIKLNELPLHVIQSLYEYVMDVKKSKNNFENAIRTVEPIQSMDKTMENTLLVEIDEPDISIDDWKMKVIEKIRNENKAKQRKKKTTTKSSTLN